MKDEFKLLDDETVTVGSTEDKKKIDLLADELVQVRYESLKSQHRLNELENGRVFRSIKHIKKSLINPVWGLKNLKAVPSLFKKVEVPPLVERPQSSRQLLEELGHATLPAGLHNHPRTMRYPHIKVAVMGEPDWLSFVAHTFDVDKVEWNQLLKFGIDMFVIKDVRDLPAAERTFKLMRREKVPFVWFIDELDEKIIKNHSDKKDLFISQAQPNSNKAEFIAPSIDITEFNPANWQVEPQKEEVRIIHATKEPSVGTNDIGSNVLFVSLDDTASFEKAKSYRYAVCDRSDFQSEIDYIKTILCLYASGVITITKGSPALKNLIDKNLHFFQDSPKIKTEATDKLQSNLFRERTSIALRNHVISEHSHINRFERILKLLNIDLMLPPLVSVVSSTNRAGNIDELIKTVAAQSYPEKEMVLILHGVEADTRQLKKTAKSKGLPIKIIKRPQNSLFGENLNLGLDLASGTFVTKMDDDDYYGPNHIWDLYWAWVYSGALAVGKWGNFVYLEKSNTTLNFATKREERFGRHLPGATIFMKRNALQKLRFGRVRRAIDSEMLRRAEMRGGRLYSTHRYNFVRVRHGEHTYKQDDEDFIANSDGKPMKGFDEKSCFI